MAQVIKISTPLEKPNLQLSSRIEGKQMVYTILLEDESEATVIKKCSKKRCLTRHDAVEALKKLADERGSDGRPLIRYGKYWVFAMRVLTERNLVGEKKFSDFIRMLESAGVTDLPTRSNLSCAMSYFGIHCPFFPDWSKGQMTDRDYGAGYDIAKRITQLLDG